MSCKLKSKMLFITIDRKTYEKKHHKCKLGGYCIGEDACQYHKRMQERFTSGSITIKQSAINPGNDYYIEFPSISEVFDTKHKSNVWRIR